MFNKEKLGVAETTTDDLTKLLTPMVQMQRIAMAVAAAGYALYSWINNDFYMPSKHGPGHHLHGLTGYMLDVSLLFAMLACLAPLLALYDARPGRPDYEKWRRYFAMTAFAMMAWGIFRDLLHPDVLPDGDKTGWEIRTFIWVILGVVAAQLGRLPPSYRRPAKSAMGHGKNRAAFSYFSVYLLLGLGGLTLAITILLLAWLPNSSYATSSGFIGFGIALLVGGLLVALAYRLHLKLSIVASNGARSRPFPWRFLYLLAGFTVIIIGYSRQHPAIDHDAVPGVQTPPTSSAPLPLHDMVVTSSTPGLNEQQHDTALLHK